MDETRLALCRSSLQLGDGYMGSSHTVRFTFVFGFCFFFLIKMLHRKVSSLNPLKYQLQGEVKAIYKRPTEPNIPVLKKQPHRRSLLNT